MIINKLCKQKLKITTHTDKHFQTWKQFMYIVSMFGSAYMQICVFANSTGKYL